MRVPRVVTTGFKRRFFATGDFSSKALMPKPEPGAIKTYPKSLVNPWKPVTDKKTGLVYYWNTETNETTPIGVPKPEHWIELPDPSGNTALTYWWNPETQETTALGVDRPRSGRLVAYANPNPIRQMQQKSAGRALGETVALGFGISLSFIIIRALLG